MSESSHPESAAGRHHDCCGCRCGPAKQRCSIPMNRRQLLGAAMATGAALLGGRIGRVLAEAEPAAAPHPPKAKILKLYSQKAGMWEDWARPDDRPWLSTEPAAVEKHLAALAERLGGVEFVGPDRPLDTKQALELAAGQAKDVDGILVFSRDNGAALWPVLELGLPTAAFNITCHAFDPHQWDLKRRQAKNPRLLVLSSRDFSELDRGIRLLRVAGMLKRSRLLVVGTPAGDAETANFEKIKAELGIQAEVLPVKDLGRFFDSVPMKSAEAEAQQYWLKPARRVYADTRREDVVKASRFQLALRQVMADRQAQAIAIDCLGALTAPKMDKEGYPCLGFSALEDEGWVTSCQCDIDCALTKLIVRCAFDLPGFLGNIYFDTGKPSVILDHCTAPTRMAGRGGPRLPFEVLTHHTNTGAAPRVYMPVAEKATVVRTVGLKGMLFYAAKITGNPEGTCRTTVELEPVGQALTPANYHPTGACGGLHHVLCLGDRVRDLKDLCTLLGLKHHADLA